MAGSVVLATAYFWSNEECVMIAVGMFRSCIKRQLEALFVANHDFSFSFDRLSEACWRWETITSQSTYFCKE